MSAIKYTVDTDEPRRGAHGPVGRPELRLAAVMPYNNGVHFANGDTLAEFTINVNANGKPWGSMELALTNYTRLSYRATHTSLNREQVAALRDWCNRALGEKASV